MGTQPIRFEPAIDLLLEGARDREPWKAADSLSGSNFERVTIDGEPFVVKYLCVDDDWIMRATGDLNCRQLTLLQSHVLDALPASIDPVVVACAPYTSRSGHRGAALLMRSVAGGLIPPGSSTIDMEVHRGFLRHMGDLHAAYWGFHDDIGLCPLAHHYVFLTPLMAETESAQVAPAPVPLAVRDGWAALAARFPADERALRDLARDPWPLVVALREGPSTLVHGDWKLGNLGSEGERTLLLDWDRSGEGPPLVDLAWYLAVNCDRLPETKEGAIAAYRVGLELHGIATQPWWDAQIRAALAGAFLQLAWSKVGDAREFGWWSDRLHEWQRLA